MKLLKLGSNLKTFRSIEFQTGLNIIIGAKNQTINNEETSNGVGKSLALSCIDFLLGKEKNIKEMKKLLEEKNIKLNLLFSKNNEQYFVERNRKNIFLNDKEISLKEYKKFLYDITLKDNVSLNNSIITFRNIFSRFFRITKSSYNSPIEQIKNEKSYSNNYINAFLLDLNLKFLEKKMELKNKQDKLNDIIKQLNNLDKGINKEKELDLQDKFDNISTNLSNFKIAENYYELEKELDDLTYSIEKLRNEKLFKEQQLRNKQKIIETNRQFNIDIDKINYIYQEAKFFFELSAIEQIEAVKNFHNTLFDNRRKKAYSDEKILQYEINEITIRYDALDKERTKLYKDLQHKGALHEYQFLIKEKENIAEKLEEIQRIKKLAIELKQNQAGLKLEIEKFKANIISLKRELEHHIYKLERLFRDISSQFYNHHKGCLDIKINNSFKTDKLYDIEVKIDADKSDGINNIKIFIYDMLLYQLNPNLIGFVGHDNILFDSIDERQIATALNYTNKNLKQYICSIHDTKFNETNKFFKSNFKLDLEQFVRLKLDENNKLFGFDF